MAIVNNAEKKILLKIIFYGPGLSGKTTAVEYLRDKYEGTSLTGEDKFSDEIKGKVDDSILEKAKKNDDYLIQLGQLKGFNVQVNLISVPGMIFHNAARQLLLRDADGVIFVADSKMDRLEANKFCLLKLRDNLYEELRGNLTGFPIVLMYNKQDLSNAASKEKMNQVINDRNYPAFETVATKGEGVNKAFKKVCSLAFKNL